MVRLFTCNYWDLINSSAILRQHSGRRANKFCILITLTKFDVGLNQNRNLLDFGL